MAYIKKTVLLSFLLFSMMGIDAQTADENSNITSMNQSTKEFAEFPDLPGRSDLSVNDPGDENMNPYALIAGGSKGIGFGIAQALARRKYNLILVARHMDGLIAAKNQLESEYQVHVEILSYDLSRDEAATEIAKWCSDKKIRLKMLCNVAGFGGAEDYLSLPLDTLRYMVRLNVESAMALSLSLLPLLEKNSPSYILNVASMAGFAPIPARAGRTALPAGRC